MMALSHHLFSLFLYLGSSKEKTFTNQDLLPNRLHQWSGLPNAIR